MERYPPSLRLQKTSCKLHELGLQMKSQHLFWLAFLPLLLLAEPTYSQEDECLDFTIEKAGKLLEKGENGGKYDREERIEFLQQAWDKDDECMACLLRWGSLEFREIKRTGGSFFAAKEPLLQLISICPNYHADVHFMLGAIAYADREYEEAQEHFHAYLRFPSEPESALGKRYDKQAKEVRQVLPTIQFELDFWSRELDFTPEIISEISLVDDEFLPALSPDGTLLFFTRRGKYKAKGDVISRDIETFNMTNRGINQDAFYPDFILEKPFNQGMKYGGASISIDNLELYIAAQNPSPENPNNIDLYMTHYNVLDRENDGTYLYIWGALRPVEGINSVNGWEAQPALSADGNELFFASVNERSIPDASGNLTMDIWSSTRDGNGQWQPPVMLMSPVNTANNDKAPFLHPDGRTLYFASDRKPSGGGYDIWFCQRDSLGVWQDAQNIGAPINTDGDEHGLIVSTDGQEGFFSSRRPGTQGLDLLKFPMPENFQPDEVSVITGFIQTTDGKVPENAQLYLQYAQSKRIQNIEINEEDGRFASIVHLDSNEDVLLISEADGLAFESQVLVDRNLPKSRKNALEAPIILEQPSNGEAFEIGDIQFKTNEAGIGRTSLLMLDAFAAYLIRNKAVGVHIIGHTDNRGELIDNQLLSEQRAAAVAHALTTAGVRRERITSVGFGETTPITTNTTEAGRARNRRTEFEILLKN